MGLTRFARRRFPLEDNVTGFRTNPSCHIRCTFSTVPLLRGAKLPLAITSRTQLMNIASLSIQGFWEVREVSLYGRASRQDKV